MAYISSGLIEAVDLNGFNALINEIRGDSYSGATGSTASRGYGQLNVTTNVSTGQVARAVDWNGLLTSISQVSQHQGTGVSVPTSVTAGNIMQVINALSGSIGTLLTNRFNIAPINATTTTNGTRLSSSRTSSWDNQIFHTYNITFTSWNAMRYFFNTGGRIISSPSFSGGSTAADTRWNSLANSVGNVVLDHTVFYNLTTSYSTIYSATNTSEEIRYRARLNGVAGSTNSIQIELRASSPNDGVQVTGTLTNRVDERRSTGVFLIPAPSYSTIIDLNSGGEVDPPISAVSISGGGTKSCSYTTGGCAVTFNLSASVTGGTGNFGYNWTLSDTTNYSITAGQGTSNLTIVSSGGSTDLPTATVSVVVSDLTMVPVTGSANTTITAEKTSGYPPFTGTTINTGGSTKSCTWNFNGPVNCTNSWSLTTSNSGGSGSFTYSWSVSPAWALPGTAATYNVTSPPSTTNQSATVSVTVTDTILGTSRSATAVINSNHKPGPVSVTITGDTGVRTCQYTSGGCSVVFNLNAVVTGGSGNFGYAWSVADTSNYSITSGQGTANLTVTSASGSTNLPATNVTVIVTDNVNSNTDSDTKSIKANKANTFDPFTAVTINTGGNNKTCLWDYDGINNGTSCSNSWTLTATPTGGSGNFTYSWSVSPTWASPGTSATYNVTSPASTTAGQSATVSLTMTDVTLGTSRSTSVVINSIHKPGPITAIYPVTNTPPGSCSYTSGNCTTSAVYSVGTTPVAGVSGVIGGSGSFTGSLTKNSGATAITGSVTGGTGTPIVATISSTNTAGTYPFNYTLRVIDNSPLASTPTGNTAVLSGTFTHVANPIDLDSIQNPLVSGIAGNETNIGEEVIASVTANFLSNGTAVQLFSSNQGGITSTFNNQWYQGSPVPNIGNNYEIFIDTSGLSILQNNVTSFVSITNTANTWQSLSSAKQIFIQAKTISGSPGTADVNGNIVVNIRPVGSSAAVSKVISVNVTAEPV